MRISATAPVDDHLGTARRTRPRSGDRQRSTVRFEDAGFKSDGVPSHCTIAYTNRGLFESPFELDDDRLVAATRRTADVRPDRRAEDPLAGDHDAVPREDHRRPAGPVAEGVDGR